jgi:hypothetical protein
LNLDFAEDARRVDALLAAAARMRDTGASSRQSSIAPDAAVGL